MQYLLDTHAFLWFINGDAQLSDLAADSSTSFRNAFRSPYNTFSDKDADDKNGGRLSLDVT